jgi:hypothetical protein
MGTSASLFSVCLFWAYKKYSLRNLLTEILLPEFHSSLVTGTGKRVSYEVQPTQEHAKKS